MTGDHPFVGRDTLWVVHIGNDDRIALRARDEGFVCIGWGSAVGDLSSYDTRKKMRRAVEEAYPNAKPKTISSSYGQPFRFAHEMQVGDPLVLPVRPTSEIAIGRVSGPYKFESQDPELVERDYCNIRPIEWLKIVPRTALSQAALHSFGSFLSVSTSDDYLEEVITVLTGRELAPTDAEEREPGEKDEEEQINLFEAASQETEDYLLKAWQRTGAQFEELVSAVFEAMGYTASVTPASADHGVDVIAHPDPLGLEEPFVKVQVKSGTGSVGEPEVNQLKGLLNPGERGILISLGKFTSGAESVARSSANLTLIDAKRFVALFLEHYDQLDPTWRARYPLKQAFVPFR